MAVILSVLVILVVLTAIAAPIIYVQAQKSFREQKNYERGLKMVPLLIHLPPSSDDIQANGRDARDITDETISKAQIIYNIIASTFKKGFKGGFYGQRHFAFEIVGVHGYIYYYASVPVTLVDVVKQAVSSAYPTARLEEVSEHNIFSKVGGASAVVGGEIDLKENFAYPIATYQDLKRDAMQSLLNSLSSLGKEDGVAVQILLRPADPSWRKVASTFASGKRKGDKNHKGAAQASEWAKSFAVALAKPPENTEKGAEKPKNELSNAENSVLDAIDEKTRYPGYETMIRIVASSNVLQQAQTILNNVNSSFALYDAPGRNGFKFTPAKDTGKLTTDYIMRIFPQTRQKNILNSVELATLFHFPDQSNIPTSQVVRQESKQVDGPRNIPEDGMLLGYNMFRGAKKPIRLGVEDRRRHMYVVGQTGTGKSTFLENMALQDMMSGKGFAFVDPHGDTAEKLLSMVPKERTEDVIYFSPADMDYPMGLNLFEYDNPDQKDFLIQEALNMLQKLYDPNHQGMMGPRYEHMFRNAALAIMADPAGGTFVDIPKLFRDPNFVKQKLEHVTDPNVLEFWQKEMPQSQRSNEFGEVMSWFVSKFGAFLSNELMRNIIGQTQSAFNLRDIMDNKKILLVNLSKGRTGELNSKLLGMVFVMKFQAAAMSRANIPEDERIDFSLYVDEFQNFSTDSFATIMSEARKFRLNLIVANQFTTQLTEEIRDAVFGNIGTIISYRIGQNDVESLSRYFQPAFDGDDLLRVPNYNAIMRTLIDGVPTQPFSIAALPPLGNPNPKLAAALKQLSAMKYGRPKAVVEREIFDRMATKTPPKPAAPASPFGSAAPTTAGSPFGSTQTTQTPGQFANTAQPAKPTANMPGTGSFLDEWLSKRGSSQPTTNFGGAPTPPPTMPSAQPAALPSAPTMPQSSQQIRTTHHTAPSLPSAELHEPEQATMINRDRQANPFGAANQAVSSVPTIESRKPAEDNDDNTITSGNAAQNVEPVTAPPVSEEVIPAQKPASSGDTDETRNISSEELDRQEVDKIAAELKRGLEDDDKQEVDDASEPDTVEPDVEDMSTISLRSSKLNPEESAIANGDTIFIDNDGNLKSLEQAQSDEESKDSEDLA